VFKLGDPVVNPNIPCIQWYLGQDDDLIKADASLAEPCPCTMTQANQDKRYTRVADDCFRPMFSGDVWNICCFDRSVCELVFDMHWIYYC
jgi:hypothetical protein